MTQFPGPKLSSISSDAGEKNGQAAFTLVELMVSVTVLSLMILFLFSVFNQATQAWQASEKKVDAFREARAALYVIRRDLSGLSVRTNLPYAVNDNSVAINGQLLSPDKAFFVSSLPSSSQGGAARGDLCTVGYYVAWSTNEYRPPGGTSVDVGASRSYNLFRYFKDSDSSYAAITNFWSLVGGGTNFGTQMSTLFPGASSQPQNGDEVLARNVVGFAIKPFWTDGTGVLQPVQGISTTRPDFFDVTLSVINYATAVRLGVGPNGEGNWKTNSAPSGMKDLLEKNVQNFYLRIPGRRE